MKKALRTLGVALFWIGVWGLAAAWIGKPLLLPGPGETARALWRLMGTAAFWQSAGMTLARVTAGYSCAVILGTLLGAACWKCGWADALLSPLRSIVKATPVASFIILVLLWISKSRAPVFIAFLMVLPIIWTNVQEALGAVDGNLIEMADAYGFSGMKKARYLYAPAVLPSFSAACMTGLGFAWKSGIAAEVIALPELAVGRKLYDAKIYLERADLFAWTLTVVLLSMALEALFKRAVRRSKGGGRNAGD